MAQSWAVSAGAAASNGAGAHNREFKDDVVGKQRLAAKGNPAVFGNLRCNVPDIVAGRWYRLALHYRVREVPCERRSVFARLSWLEAEGKRQHDTDLLWRTEPAADWVKLQGTFQAPEKATGADLELYFAWARDGVVWWDDITVAGTGKGYCEVAEPVPGPTTATLGETARRHHCYLVAGLYERVGAVVYNTSVLLDREGQLVGTYRKTHLPNEEYTKGVTPGDAYPVFATDFGTVGMMICWDVQFPEPARALAAQGADLILLPIWGGNEILARARAIENHVTLVISSYDMKTMVINPRGDILCEASKEHPVAVTEVDLDAKVMQHWIGDMKGRAQRERRTELRVPELER